MHALSRSICKAFYIPILMLWLALTANAQFRAALQGTVTDAQVAVVVGASVTLINKETNRTQQATSGDEGFYRFDRLPPGKYILIVEHAGFKKNVLRDVDVGAEDVQGINIKLDVGEIADTVTVSAELAQQLKTENANVSRVITGPEIQRLPQFGRDPYELVRLAPGVFGLGARDPCCRSVGFPNSAGPGSNNSIFQPENQVPISANGQRVTANNYEVDGVSVNSQVWGGAAVLTPNQESVKEMSVSSSSYSAENGRNTGALIQVVSRNGTNDFHGSAFLKYEDPALNAFNKWGGPFGRPQRVENHFRQWGGSLGGPIYLPRFGTSGPSYWSGKDKLFFFFSYETLRNRANNVENLWIETPEFGQLLLSQRAGSLAARIVNTPGMDHRIVGVLPGDCASVGMVNPSSCRAVPGGLDIGSPTGSIGQSTTNIAGGGLDNIPDIRHAQVLFASSNKSQQFSTRTDYQITDHDLLVFSIYNTPNDTRFSPNGRPIQDFLSARRNVAGALLWNHTLSPTTLNEARFNVTRWYLDEIKSNPDVPFGIPSVPVSFIPFGPFGVNWGPSGVNVVYQTSYNFRDILSTVAGNHGLKFGGEIANEQNNDNLAQGARPTYFFSGIWNFTNDAPTREFGLFDPRTGIPTDVKKYIRSKIYSLFAQDDWKIRPNLTLNLGLRWEYFAPPEEKYGNISNLVLGPGESALTDATFKLGGKLFEPDRNNFGPQIGFAWSPKTVFGINVKDKAVLRGGFGIGYNRLTESVTLNGRSNPPFVADFSLGGSQILYSLGSSLTSFYGWPSNPNTILRFDPNTHMPLSGPRASAFTTLEKVPNPYTYRYSLDAQYDLGKNWVASVGYQGSAGRKLPRIVNFDLFVPHNSNLANVELLLTDVNTNFNAMIAQLTHRFARSFDVHAQYRWSKSIDTCSNDDNCPQTYPFDQKTERGPSDYDVTHAFSASGLWDLPIFRNRRDFVGKAFGGWQVNAIVTASSGFPWTPVYVSGCVNLNRRGFLCPLRPVAYTGGLEQDLSNEAFQRPGGTFGITDASDFFVPPPGGQVAVPPRPGIGRNVFRGPRYFSADVSLVKRISMPKFTRLGETAGLDLRANFFNVFNTLNLAPFEFGSHSTRIDSPLFGRATGALAGRVVEFQARFFF